MNYQLRSFLDRTFTALAALAVVLITAALIVILVPMLGRGFSAVFFKGTVEFRQMQLDLFAHGDSEQVARERALVDELRLPLFNTLRRFSLGIDTQPLIDQTRKIHRDFGQQLHHLNTSPDRYLALRERTKEFRDQLTEAFESTDKSRVNQLLDAVLACRDDPDFHDTLAAQLFTLAHDYQQAIAALDLTRRDQYAQALDEVTQALRHLFGPLPGEPTPPLSMDQYGAVRWDMAQRYLKQLLYDEQWLEEQPGQPLVRKYSPRAQTQFAGTLLENWFADVEQNLTQTLRPRPTFYWRYFLDNSTPGYFFGGVGPEILGTLLMTFIALLFAIPLGVLSAGYLVECAGDNLTVRVIRTCINTLAGVPSIVFGLFGLAFFVLYLLPLFGRLSKPCILTASLTLAVLVLPVIIRASEEAIRSVPHTYKEASLALGAGQFRTFVKVTLPTALPGILTGIILSLSRAAGETAPIMFTGAVALGPLPRSLFESSRALPYASYVIATGDRLSMLVPHQQYGMVMTLILLVLALNITAIFLRSHMSKKLRGY